MGSRSEGNKLICRSCGEWRIENYCRKCEKYLNKEESNNK